MAAPDMVKAVVCHGPENFELEEIPCPKPHQGEALVRVEAVGICASDLKAYHGAAKFWGDDERAPYMETEVTPGHEFVGVIEELDQEAVDRWHVQPGDRVVSEQIVPCGECRFCRRGEYWMCEPHAVYGFKRRVQGGMASYMVFPRQAIVHRISKDLPAAHAAFTEPLSCALHGVERAEIRFEDMVVVAGCGPIGLGMVAGSKAKGAAAVVALDVSNDRLELARLCGADVVVNIKESNPWDVVSDMTGGYGADVYIEASGHADAVPQGLKLLRRHGRFVEYGVFGSKVSVDWSIISDDKELDVRGAHLGPHCWPAAIKMLESGALPMDGICTHQLPLERFREGFDLVSDGTKSVKVTLMP